MQAGIKGCRKFYAPFLSLFRRLRRVGLGQEPKVSASRSTACSIAARHASNGAANSDEAAAGMVGNAGADTGGTGLSDILVAFLLGVIGSYGVDQLLDDALEAVHDRHLVSGQNFLLPNHLSD